MHSDRLAPSWERMQETSPSRVQVSSLESALTLSRITLRATTTPPRAASPCSATRAVTATLRQVAAPFITTTAAATLRQAPAPFIPTPAATILRQAPAPLARHRTAEANRPLGPAGPRQQHDRPQKQRRPDCRWRDQHNRVCQYIHLSS